MTCLEVSGRISLLAATVAASGCSLAPRDSRALELVLLRGGQSAGGGPEPAPA
jgi:hypothetical protein